MKRLKILVVDDDQRHLAVAREQLGEQHDLITTDSYEEAIEQLKENTDVEILLCDLLMPAEPYALGTEGLKHLGHPIPIGLILVLRAARCGVKSVACITDANHHNHPMSAALDWINPAYWDGSRERLMSINAAQVLVAHAHMDGSGRKDWQAALNVLLSEKE